MRLRGLVFLLIGLALGVGLGMLVYFNGPNASTPATERRLPPGVGSPVKDFVLTSLDEQPYRMSDLEGTPVVVNFWATWCGPCKEEMPLLERYAQKYDGRLLVLGVDYAEDAAVVQKFVTEQNITFPILLDESGMAADLYFVRNFPQTFFVDSEGILRAQHLGLLTEDLLVRYLKTIGIEE